MSDKGAMNGTQRAALLLMTLGEKEAAEVLKYMGAKEVQELGTAMASLRNVSRDQADGVLDVFITDVEEQTAFGVDTEGYHRYSNPHDLVVLAVGMEPSVAKSDFPIDVVINESGYIEADEKNGGIFAAGCSADALDVNRAVQSATASALRAIQVVNRVAGTEG